MSSPSISVMNCGSAFSFASHLRQSYSVCPIARELLNRRKLHALRCIIDGLLIRPARGSDAPAKIVKDGIWNVDVERADRLVFACCVRFRGKHGGSTCSCRTGKKATPVGR